MEQLQALQQARCDEVQGYFFSKPMDARAIGELINAAGKPDFQVASDTAVLSSTCLPDAPRTDLASAAIHGSGFEGRGQ